MNSLKKLKDSISDKKQRVYIKFSANSYWIIHKELVESV